MSETDEIVIDRLNLNAGKKDVTASISALKNSSWSFQSNNSWLFVRQLNVSGHKNELRMQASQALNAAAQSAMDSRQRNAFNANAVSFSSFPELLAFLLNDIVDGQFARRWYWRRWLYLLRETKANAIARVLWENSEYLAAIIDHLIKNDKLGRIWSQLTHQSAGEILQRMESNHPVFDDARLFTETQSKSMSFQAINFTRRYLVSDSKRLIAWRNVLEPLTDADYRTMLAIRIIAQHGLGKLYSRWPKQVESIIIKTLRKKRPQPAAARSSEIESLQDELTIERANKLSDKTFNRTDKNASHPSIPNKETHFVASKIDIKPHRSDNDIRIYSHPKPSDESFKTEERSNGDAGFVKDELEILSASIRDPQKTLAAKDMDPLPQVENQKYLQEFEFLTQYGGLFYLVNLLRFKDCQTILENDLETPSGWLWLYDLARQLEVTLDESITEFILKQLAEHDIQQLHRWPPIAAISGVVDYLNSNPKTSHLFNNKLIQVPAQVIATTSHIDVYFSLSSIRLDVRLAGLDVNPGWVNWLGRVINFHYVDKLPNQGKGND